MHGYEQIISSISEGRPTGMRVVVGEPVKVTLVGKTYT